ncbi:GDSL-type esterase/lipase family protein [Spirillospora sp. NPDC127200]
MMFLRAAKISVGAMVGAALIAGMVQTSPARHAAARLGASEEHWAGVWGAAPQRPGATDGDWAREGFADQSVRQVVRVTAGGERLRLRLSNRYGDRPLRVAGAMVGRSAGGAAVQPGAAAVTFGRAAGTVVPPGAEALSDPVPLSIAPLERLAVTLRFGEATGPATFHRMAASPSYRASGDRLADITGDAYRESSPSWYFLAGVEAVGGPRRTAVVLGDSLADGAGFPDRLAERLAAGHRSWGVVNAGIGASRLLGGPACGGDGGLERFRRDVLGRPGARAVLVQLGAGDITDPCPGDEATARDLIAAHRELIKAARAHGVKAVGMTLPPLKGAPAWTPERERVRQELNRWIREGGEYDAVADVAGALADPADPQRLRPGYATPGVPVPNDAGQHAVAGAVDPKAL